MRILILGGTRFLGRHLAVEALRRGHQVTLFNRGTRPVPSAGAEHIVGDRRCDLARLDGRVWEAAIDTSGYVPGQVRNAALSLAHNCLHFTFVSTLSAYADEPAATFDESCPLATMPPEEVAHFEAVEPAGPIPAYAYGERYGALKALCEAAATESFFERLLIVRPGLVIGPDDYSNRFAYWPARFAAGGEVLAPGSPRQRLQMIDVRDLARWTIEMIERRQTGVFNVTGLPTTMEAVLEACRDTAGPSASLTWVGDEFLLGHSVKPWMELPLWIPIAVDPGAPLRANVDAALGLGLRLRPLAETVADTLRWDLTRPLDERRQGTFNRGRELSLLESWHATQG